MSKSWDAGDNNDTDVVGDDEDGGTMNMRDSDGGGGEPMGAA